MEMGTDTEHSDLKKDKEGQGNIIQCRETRDIRKRPELEPENSRGESHSVSGRGKSVLEDRRVISAEGQQRQIGGRVKQQLN